MPVQNELFGLLGRNSSVILDTKKSLQKTASPTLSASLAEPVRSTAAMPEITHLWDVSWSPGPACGWPFFIVEETGKAECPPRAQCEGTLIISYQGGDSMSRPPSPSKAVTPRALLVTTCQGRPLLRGPETCSVFSLTLLAYYSRHQRLLPNFRFIPQM